MEFIWGQSPGKLRLFQGYVNHRESVESAGESRIRYMCVGSSLPLNEPSLSSWSGVSASYVAKRIAEKHGLRAVVSKSAEIHPYVSSGNGSDFNLLKSLADKTGNRFWVSGATLFFVDPMTLIRRSNHAPELVLGSGGIMQQWDVVSGTLAPREGSVGTVKRVFGIDRYSGRLLQSSSAKALRDRGLSVPNRKAILTGSVESVRDARVLAGNAATNLDWVTARADIRGRGDVRLGGLVEVDGARVREEARGRWLVASIIHVIENDGNQFEYNAEVSLTRNNTEDVQFRESANVGLGDKDIPAVLVSGERWESKVKESVYV